MDWQQGRRSGNIDDRRATDLSGHWSTQQDNLQLQEVGALNRLISMNPELAARVQQMAEGNRATLPDYYAYQDQPELTLDHRAGVSPVVKALYAQKMLEAMGRKK